MPPTITTVLIPTRDLAASKAVLTALLGTGPSVDESYYVGFDQGGVHVGLNPKGHDQGLPGPVAYWAVEDIEGALQAVVAAGGKERQAIQSVGGSRRVALVEDAAGNVLGLLQDG